MLLLALSSLIWSFTFATSSAGQLTSNGGPFAPLGRLLATTGKRPIMNLLDAAYFPNYCNNTDMITQLGLLRSPLGQFLGWPCSNEFFHCHWQTDGYRTYRKLCKKGLVYDTLGTQNCNYDYNVRACGLEGKGIAKCKENQFTCPLSTQCVSLGQRCDGTYDCAREEDEQNCPMCNPSEFACTVSEQCIPMSQRCNGVVECSDGTDEQGCEDCGQGKWPCLKSGKCIAAKMRCDGVVQCPHGEDELLCKKEVISRHSTHGGSMSNSHNQVERPCPENAKETMRADPRIEGALIPPSNALFPRVEFDSRSLPIRPIAVAPPTLIEAHSNQTLLKRSQPRPVKEILPLLIIKRPTASETNNAQPEIGGATAKITAPRAAKEEDNGLTHDTAPGAPTTTGSLRKSATVVMGVRKTDLTNDPSLPSKAEAGQHSTFSALVGPIGMDDKLSGAYGSGMAKPSPHILEDVNSGLGRREGGVERLRAVSVGPCLFPDVGAAATLTATTSSDPCENYSPTVPETNIFATTLPTKQPATESQPGQFLKRLEKLLVNPCSGGASYTVVPGTASEKQASLALKERALVSGPSTSEVVLPATTSAKPRVDKVPLTVSNNRSSGLEKSLASQYKGSNQLPCYSVDYEEMPQPLRGPETLGQNQEMGSVAVDKADREEIVQQVSTTTTKPSSPQFATPAGQARPIDKMETQDENVQILRRLTSKYGRSARNLLKIIENLLESSEITRNQPLGSESSIIIGGKRSRE